jgi:hypothetical protein
MSTDDFPLGTDQERSEIVRSKRRKDMGGKLTDEELQRELMAKAGAAIEDVAIQSR